MDASIDLKTVATLLGVLASVIGKMDTRTDRLHTQIETQQQKLLILSGMMSPDHEAVRHREAANILCRIARLEKDVLE